MKLTNKIFLLLFFSFVISLHAFEIGEKLSFELNYGMISAGSSTIKINEITYLDSINCLEISSYSKTNKFFDKIIKVRDKINSIWDIEKNHSYKFSKKLHEGRYIQNRIHFYYPEKGLTVYMKKDKKSTKYKTKNFETPHHKSLFEISSPCGL